MLKFFQKIELFNFWYKEGFQSNISKIDFVGNKYLSAKYLKVILSLMKKVYFFI